MNLKSALEGVIYNIKIRLTEEFFGDFKEHHKSFCGPRFVNLFSGESESSVDQNVSFFLIGEYLRRLISERLR